MADESRQPPPVNIIVPRPGTLFGPSPSATGTAQPSTGYVHIEMEKLPDIVEELDQIPATVRRLVAELDEADAALRTPSVFGGLPAAGEVITAARHESNAFRKDLDALAKRAAATADNVETAALMYQGADERTADQVNAVGRKLGPPAPTSPAPR